MTTSPTKASRKINATEVKQWFGNSSKAQLRPAQYDEIATRLTKFRWPSDPPAPPDSPWLPKIIETDPDRYWDFQATTQAAKTLLDSVPAMLSHWAGLRWAPETRGGYDAIKALSDALLVALPHIEWPFGEIERLNGQKRLKDWHTPAIIIANVVIKAMIEAGNNEPGITKIKVSPTRDTKAWPAPLDQYSS